MNKGKPGTQGRTRSIDSGGTLLMGSPPLAFRPLCLYSSVRLASNGPTHSGLGPYTSIIEKTPQKHIHRPIHWKWASIEASSSQATLVWGKLTKANRNSMSEKLILMRQICYREAFVYLSLQHPTICGIYKNGWFLAQRHVWCRCFPWEFQGFLAHWSQLWRGSGYGDMECELNYACKELTCLPVPEKCSRHLVRKTFTS